MEATDYLRAALALAFTLSLMGLVAWAVGRFGRHWPVLSGASAGPPRLTVLERRMIDPRHQMVLVRRDASEHLLLLCAHAAPVVIESRIQPGGERQA